MAGQRCGSTGRSLGSDSADRAWRGPTRRPASDRPARTPLRRWHSGSVPAVCAETHSSRRHLRHPRSMTKAPDPQGRTLLRHNGNSFAAHADAAVVGERQAGRQPNRLDQTPAVSVLDEHVHPAGPRASPRTPSQAIVSFAHREQVNAAVPAYARQPFHALVRRRREKSSDRTRSGAKSPANSRTRAAYPAPVGTASTSK
jgi:hypothetical protein